MPALMHALRMLYGLGHALVAALDGSCGALTLPPHVQAARYAPGQYYRRHTDNMPADPASIRHVPTNLREQLMSFALRSWRSFTVLLYANPGWVPEHGGCLRLHHETGGFADVPPLAGRALIFNSLHQHEVLPAAVHDRWALTMWVWREDGDLSKFAVS